MTAITIPYVTLCPTENPGNNHDVTKVAIPVINPDLRFTSLNIPNERKRLILYDFISS
jgi:hypothetical protein